MSQSYPFLTHFRAKPVETLLIAENDSELGTHQIIHKYTAQFSLSTFRIIRHIGIMMLFIKFGTTAMHLRRSLALSAPMNRYTGTLKYVVIPGTTAWMLENNRYQEMMADLQDLKDPQINQRFAQILKQNEKQKTH